MPIVTGETALDLENESTVVPIFEQVFGFGDRIDKSIINPNQFRHNGITFYDDPTDNYLDLELAIDDNLFIQMGIDGTTFVFDSHCPTLD